MTRIDEESGDVRVPAWRRYLRFWREAPAADVEDEIRFHLEGLAEEYRQRGLGEEEARRAAHARFGNVSRVSSDMRRIATRRGRRESWRVALIGWRQDVRFAVRSLRRTPWLTWTAVSTLAIGIGAAGATGGLLDQVVRRAPAGVHRPSELRRVWVRQFDRFHSRARTLPSVSVPRFAAIAAALGGDVRHGLFIADTAVRLGQGAGAPPVRMAMANAAYFRTLGVRLRAGRTFDASEDLEREPSPVAIVSERFAARHLGGVGDAVGRRIELRARQYTVIGVVGGDFTGLGLQPTDVWVPLGNYPAPTLRGLPPWWQRHVFPGLHAVVRLPRGADDVALETRATSALAGLERSRADADADTALAVRFGAIAALAGPGEPARELQVTWRLALLSGALLAVAVANAAALLLTRATGRRRETAIRVAIGASRQRLLRLVTIESLLLGAFAGVLALAGGVVLGRVLRGALFPGVTWARPVVDVRVAASLLGAAIVATWLAGAWAAWRSARRDPADLLRGTSHTATPAQRPVRFTLAAVQVALSVVVLTAATLFATSLREVRALDLGYDAERVLVATPRFDPPEGAPSDRDVRARMAEVRASVSRLPGVASTAVSLVRPLSGSWVIAQYHTGADSLQSIPSSDDWPALFPVTPEFFRTTGIRVLRGRTFEHETDRGVVVNETMARMLWRGRDPLSACLHLERRASPCRPIIGVVEDSRRNELLEGPRPQYFVTLATFAPDEGAVLSVRVDPARRASVQAALRAQLGEAFPGATPQVESLAQTLAPQYYTWRVGSRITGVLGMISVLVTLIGVFGTVAYDVATRTRELGVRVALGARHGDIARTVGGDGLRPVLAGVLGGLLLSLPAGRALDGLLYGVSPWDARVLALVSSVMVLVSLAAMAVPVRRAMRADPLVALRAD